MGYQFDRQPCVGALVVSLEGHNGATRPIECLIRMLRVANEIAPVFLATRSVATLALGSQPRQRGCKGAT
jgi:hypothetical protein